MMRALEPEQLRRRKQFHQRVQRDWTGTIEQQPVHIERDIALRAPPRSTSSSRRGRIDLFVDQTDDFETVVEIKSTNWDRVKPKDRRRLLAAHCRQVFKYVDTYLDRERVNVCAGITYPKPPSEPAVRAEVEEFLNGRALQVDWYDE